MSAGAGGVRRLLHVGPRPPGKTLAPVGCGEGVIVELKKDIDPVLGEGLRKTRVAPKFEITKCGLYEEYLVLEVQ